MCWLQFLNAAFINNRILKLFTTIFFTLILCSYNLYAQKVIEQKSDTVKPSIFWGAFPPGRVEFGVFKKQTQIKLPDGYTLKKAIINFAGAGFQKVERYNLYSQDLDKLSEVISRCVPGTVVIVEKILTVDRNGQEVFLSNAGFPLF